MLSAEPHRTVVHAQSHKRKPLARSFLLFSLFFQEIISERPLVFRGNPEFQIARWSQKQRNHRLFFAVSRCL
jgi:hypothetical protein